MSWQRHMARLRGLFGGSGRVDDLNEEIRAHLELEADENREAGMTADEARFAARRTFGNVTLAKEGSRDMWIYRSLEIFLQDVRYGLRMLGKNPGFTAVAVLTLALGIGANAAMFSVLHAVLLEPLPYPESNRLVTVWEKVRLPSYQNNRNEPSPGNFADWRKKNTVFEDMAAVRARSFNLTGTGEPVRVEGEAVSASLFSVLRMQAARGRVFTTEEDRPGGARVAVISEGLWGSRFGSDAQTVGRTILLDGEPYMVIGIMPAGFHFPDPDDQLWVPLALSDADLANHGSHFLYRVVARLRPQVSLAQARAEMDTIAARIAEQYPQSNTGQTVNLVPLRDDFVGALRPALLVLSGAVGLILLIVCANVANLLLARAVARQKEMAIRVALGAGRTRILRQLLTESTLLALLGGSLGLVLAYGGVEALKLVSPPDLGAEFGGLPRVSEIGISGPVLAFCLGISLLAGTVFGTAPALHAARNNLQDALKERAGEPRIGRWFQKRSMLVVAEMALGLLVVIGAGLLLRSFLALQQVSLGFQPQSVLTFRVIPRGERYAQSSARAIFYQQAIEKIEALPGVKSAAVVTFIPLTFARGSKGFTIEGQAPLTPGQIPIASYDVVTPGYFSTMQIPLLEGRDFSWADAPDTQPVVVINEAMAHTYWPNEDALGKHVKQGSSGETNPWLTIDGVVGDVRSFDVVTPPRPTVYFPTSQFQGGSGGSGILRDWVVRTTGDPSALAPAVRQAIWAIDSNLAVSRMKTMEEVRSASVAPQRFNALLFGIFAGLALLLAAVGIYGVTAYSVTQRTHEIGIRMTLGARPYDVLKMVVGQGARLALAGVLAGLAGALVFTRLMGTLLYGVSATDPLTFAGVAGLLGIVAVAACLVPARRATRVDPMTALRHE